MFADQLLHQRYKLIDTLANGGMATVYLAEDLQNPEDPGCVVKTLRPISADPSQLTMAKTLFHRGASALNKLGVHPQIPRLIDFFEEDQIFYTVEEYIQGHPLSAELQPGRRWSEADVLELLSEILPILEFVHGQNVIHRDIKPDNIIRRDSDQKLALIDFGAVREINTSQTTVGPGRGGTVVGTFGYMPTEQGHGNPRPNSDIYALGMVCIQAITGLLPSQLLQDPETGEVRWHGYVPVSQDLTNILTKMVRYHFKDRYTSAEEAMRAVKTLQRKLETPASSESRSQKHLSQSRATQMLQPLAEGKKMFRLPRPVWLGLAALASVSVLGTAVGLWAALTPKTVSLGGDKVLDVGVVNMRQRNPIGNYAKLQAYLESQLQAKYGPDVRVQLHPIPIRDQASAIQAVKNQKWDLAFTGSQTVSITAVDNNYRYVARMFKEDTETRSVFYVRQNSPLKSPQDIKATTTVALADLTNAFGFSMPVYDLYGTTFKADFGNRLPEIKDKVLNGQADVGVASLRMFKRWQAENPNLDLRILGEPSRAIPPASVFVSSRLPSSEQDFLATALRNAPTDVQDTAGYAIGQPISYVDWKAIQEKADLVSSCIPWQKGMLKLVSLTCTSATANVAPVIGTTLNQFDFQANQVVYRLVGEDNKTYKLVLPRTLIEQDARFKSVHDLKAQKVVVTNVQPVLVGEVMELQIKEAAQLQMLR